MTTAEARAYANQRYTELSEDNPTWSRCQISTLIIEELRKEHNFVLTVGGSPIMGVSENDWGLTYHLPNVVVVED